MRAILILLLFLQACAETKIEINPERNIDIEKTRQTQRVVH
jgi:hypothetical protein